MSTFATTLLKIFDLKRGSWKKFPMRVEPMSR